jgi:hypothetical protein
MPDVPWSNRSELEPERTYLVLASLLQLTRISSTVRFFRAASGVRKQLASAEGLVGYSLRAKPLSLRYWTLSIWTDQTALQEFVRTSPHLGVMSSLKPFMARTTFVQWEITGVDGRPSWTDALDHLAAAGSSAAARSRS